MSDCCEPLEYNTKKCDKTTAPLAAGGWVRALVYSCIDKEIPLLIEVHNSCWKTGSRFNLTVRRAAIGGRLNEATEIGSVVIAPRTAGYDAERARIVFRAGHHEGKVKFGNCTARGEEESMLMRRARLCLRALVQ